MCDFCSTTYNRQSIESSFSASLHLEKHHFGPPSAFFIAEINAGDLGIFETVSEFEIKYCPFCGEQLYEDEDEGDDNEN